MPYYEVIASETKIPNPGIDDIIEYLEQKGRPVALAKNALQVIAPAVNILHSRITDLLAILSSKDHDSNRYRRTINYAFSKSTDMYIILAGIEAAPGSEASKLLRDEKKFARKLISIVFDIFIEIGGQPTTGWEPVPLERSSLQTYRDRLFELRKEFPLPEFARRENMKKQVSIGSLVFAIILVIFFMLDTGILQEIFRSIFDR